MLDRILGSAVEEAEASYRLIYEHHAPLMGFLGDIGATMPRVLRTTSEFVVNALLRRAFEREELQVDRIRTLLDTAGREKIKLDAELLSFTLKRRLEAMADELAVNPREQTLEQFNAAITLVRSLPFEVDIWKMQNVYHHLLRSVYTEIVTRDDERWLSWAQQFAELGEKLGMRVEEWPAEPVSRAA